MFTKRRSRKSIYTRLFGQLDDDYKTDGWYYDHVGDPHAPSRGSTPVGPWYDANPNALHCDGPIVYDDGSDGRTWPVHGIVARDRDDGLTEWVAVRNGWPLFRWAGPVICWTSPLVSPWNPILTQDLADDPPIGYPSGWFDLPGGHDRWTCQAILAGRKPAGYFGRVDGSRRLQRSAVDELRDVGLTVARIGRQRLASCCWAAIDGTLCEVFGRESLDRLSDEYERVLSRHDVCYCDVRAEIDEHAHTPVIDLAIHHEEVPEFVCGLVLGYPPEVTAGVMIRNARRPDEWGYYAENGCYDPRDRTVVEEREIRS